MKTSRKQLRDVTKNFLEKKGENNVQNKLTVSTLPVTEYVIHTYLKLVF